MTSPATVDHSTGNGECQLPPPAVLFHLATLYFDYIHDQLHSLFQKPAFMADLATNEHPPSILFAMVALAARCAERTAYTSCRSS